jgi:hypothetical protein
VTCRSQAEHPAPPVDGAARSGVGGVAVDVARDADRTVPDQIGDRFDVHAAFQRADGHHCATIDRAARYVAGAISSSVSALDREALSTLAFNAGP